MHVWMNEQNWAWIFLLIIPWLLLVGAAGYAAVHVALRDLHKGAPLRHQ